MQASAVVKDTPATSSDKVARLLERLLSDHTRELEALVTDAPLGFGYLSLPDMRFRYVNSALAKLSGVSAEQMLNQTPKEVLGRVVSRRAYTILRRSVLTGSPLREMEAEVEVPDRPGERGRLVINYYPVPGKDGRAVGLWIMAQDITERRRLEQEVPAQRARLQSLMDAAPAGILVCDAAGNLLYANAEAERIWGHALLKTGIAGYEGYQIFHLDGRKAKPEESALARALADGHSRVTTERILKRPDGSQLYVYSIATPVRDEAGRLTGAILFFHDYTNLKTLQERQRRVAAIAQAVNRGESLSAVLRMVRDSIVETAGFDRVGIWLHDERAGGMRGSWGTSRKGEPVDESREFFPLSREGDHPLQRLLRGDIRYHRTPRYEFSSTPGGSVDMRGVGAHASIALTAHDRVIGMVFVDNLLTGRPIEDTDMEALLPFCEQAALAIHSVRLREAERAQAARLAESVRETNHRVKNNLQVVAALLDMRLMESGETVSRADVERLTRQIRAIAAVHDFLSHERADMDVDARRVLEKLIPMLEAGTGASCRLEAASAPVSVKQGTALALVLNELVSNAAKHGGRQIRVAFTATDSRRRLEVTDDGPGFPADFDADRDGNLGLDLVATLARWDLQGEIEFANAEQGGARVVMEFDAPCQAQEPLPEHAASFGSDTL